MRTLILLSMLLYVSGCSEPVLPPAAGAGDEPPFFVADRDATGPLSLEELQINLPSELKGMLSTTQQACFFESVERRAQEAGDPSDLDFEALPYWGGEMNDKEWAKHDAYMQRVLLAQGIVSWAMVDC